MSVLTEFWKVSSYSLAEVHWRLEVFIASISYRPDNGSDKHLWNIDQNLNFILMYVLFKYKFL